VYADPGRLVCHGGELVTTTKPLESHARPTNLERGEELSGDPARVLASGTNGARDGFLRIASLKAALPGDLKLGPVLPARLRPLTRPMPWVEIALIGISYYLYRLTQIAAPSHQQAAYNRGNAILRLEADLHINFEHWLNHAVNGVEWLVVPMNYYYATLHFIVPVVVLVWVYWKFPDRYRAIRTVLFGTTGLALIGFYFYALCPPRLLPGGGFVDTFYVHHTWGNRTSDGPAGIAGSAANVFAAMPSLHVGWSVFCAMTIVHLAKRRWVKILGILYPCATFVVIISTANHYVLDAVGGLVVLAAGFLLQRILQGRSVYEPATEDVTALPRQKPISDEDTRPVPAQV
jgi:hypothetical protein